MLSFSLRRVIPSLSSTPQHNTSPLTLFRNRLGVLGRHHATSSISNDTDYHRQVDQLFMDLQDTIEDVCDEHGVTELDVTYASGVFTLQTPQGTYVINKQPSTHQIWFSSPVSGPKRFVKDHVAWKDVRDTNAGLISVLENELKVWYPWIQLHGK